MDSNGKKIIREWTRSDFKAVGEWINALEKGKPRDEAVVTHAGTLAEHEPQAADVWAESLSPGPLQNDLRKDIYRQIRRKDQAASRSSIFQVQRIRGFPGIPRSVFGPSGTLMGAFFLGAIFFCSWK
jgi:hypothetical protein